MQKHPGRVGKCGFSPSFTIQFSLCVCLDQWSVLKFVRSASWNPTGAVLSVLWVSPLLLSHLQLPSVIVMTSVACCGEALNTRCLCMPMTSFCTFPIQTCCYRLSCIYLKKIAISLDINRTCTRLNSSRATALQCTFRITKNSFTYVVVSVTHSFDELFKANFVKLFEQTKKDLSKWSPLNLTLICHINSGRMTVLGTSIYPNVLQVFRLLSFHHLFGMANNLDYVRLFSRGQTTKGPWLFPILNVTIL